MTGSGKAVCLLGLCGAAAACNSQVTVGSRYAKSQLVLALTGGTVVVTSADDPTLAGTAIHIPPEALAKDTVITIAEANPLPLSGDATAVGPVAELGPPGTTFALPATIVLPCRRAGGQGSADLSVQGLDSSGSTSNVSGADLGLDDVAGTVAFTASRLLTFGCTLSLGTTSTTDGGAGGGAAGGGSGGGAAGGGSGGGGGEPVYGDAGTNGVPVGDAPSWQERVVLLLTNAVRVDPAGYKASYGSDWLPAMGASVLGNTYPAVAPVHWNVGLSQSSRFHATDMATYGCFQLVSCDGTSLSERVARFYTLSTDVAENYSGGLAEPRQTVNQWLCSGSGSCCTDRTSCDEARTIIMDSRFHALGVGRATSTTTQYTTYWVQDFGGVAAPPAPPLVEGSHLFYPSGKTTFAATFAASGAPRSVFVFLDGVATPLSLALGTSTRGHWAAQTDTASQCRSYYFEAVDAQGVTWRYPALGALRTTGEGSCTESFQKF